jgi:replication factor A1
LAGDTEIHAGERSSIEVDPENMPNSDLPEFGDLFTPLGKLVAGANQVNAIGIVQTEPRHYNFAKEERTGSVLRAFIADESGGIPLVAWNERAEELRDLKSNAIVQALNARVRLDRNGGPELHVESRSQIQILKTPPPFLRLPVTKTCKIAELAPVASVNLAASVLSVSGPQEIKRPSGQSTRVTRLLVADETGIITISLWDDKSDIASTLHEGDSIEITGASVRERQGDIMLSLGQFGKLQKTEVRMGSLKGVTKLKMLPQSKGLVIVEGAVADTPIARQVVTEKGENVDLVSLTLRDDTGASRVTFWRDQTAGALKLKPGLRVRMEGVRVRAGLSGDFELSSIPITRLEIMEEREKDKPAWEDIRHVIALEPGLKTWVKGVILETLDKPNVRFLCESCGSELEFGENQLRCEKCNMIRSGRLVLSAHLRVDDGTGVVSVMLLSADANSLSTLERAVIISQMLEKNVSVLQLGEEQRLSLNGKEIELHGTAKQSAKDGKLEFVADKVMLAGSA